MTDAVSPLNVPDVRPRRASSTRNVPAGLASAASGWIVPTLILAAVAGRLEPRLRF